MANSKLSMKLLIETKGKRVLFAEAGKDCVDFLFHILSLPVATVIRLLKPQEMEGSWPNLYRSLEDLNEDYVLPSLDKYTFLKPAAPISSAPMPFLDLGDDQPIEKLYGCSNCYSSYYSDDEAAICPSCNRKMSKTLAYVAPPAVKVAGEGGGIVKGVVTYMVMDDLTIKPMSSISIITLLNKFHVKDVGVLEEKEVKVGMNEALKILKASQKSKKVLTEVFC